MCLPPARVHVLLAALLLPVCALAEPLRLQLTPFASEVPATVKELQPKLLEERTRSGLQQALKKNTPKEFELLSANSPDSADIFITGKVIRQGSKYRITYSLQTNGPNRTQSSLNYDFATPRLAPKGVVVMARDMLDEARKLGQARGAAPVATAPPPPAAAAPGTESPPAASPGTAPEGAAPVAQATPPPAPEGLPTPRRYSHPQPSESGPSDSSDAPRLRADSSDGAGDTPSDRERDERERRDRRDRRDEDEDSRPHERRVGEAHLDIGVAGGLNNPGGLAGLEVEYRPFSHLGFQLTGGYGAWGPRVNPNVRLHFFGYTPFSLMLEAGMGLNLGGTASITVNGETASILLPPAFTFTGCLVGRTSVGRYFYFSTRLGYAVALNPNIPLKDGNGNPVDPTLNILTNLAQQGGLVVGLSAGLSPF